MLPSLLSKTCCRSRLRTTGFGHNVQHVRFTRQSPCNTPPYHRRLWSSRSPHPQFSPPPPPLLLLRQPRTGSSGRASYPNARHLSVSPKQWAKLKVDIRQAFIYAAYFYAFAFLITVMAFGAKDERYNRLFPTPPEWGFFLRMRMRHTRGSEVFYDTNAGIPNWPELGMRYRNVVNRLEKNHRAIDTRNMPVEEKVRLEQAGVAFDGFNYDGVDVSDKSVPWREGYHIALMGAARAAEFLDDLVADVTRREIFSKERVIGPSNPHPKPQPYGAIEAPLEENCAAAFLSPKIFYDKIMATEGFNARQRLETSLAWANWLSATGQNEEAEEKYDWALDIAMGDLPQGMDNVVDTRTGCIDESAAYITEGIITATTALATFHAQQQNFATALPIFASIVRAYRSLPPPSYTTIPIYGQAVPEVSAWSLVWSTVVSALSAPTYPNPPPSISVPLISTPKQTCSEAAVMSNLGEILFASSTSNPASSLPSPTSSILRALSFQSPSQPIATPAELSGLSWTRSAVDQTEATIDILGDNPPRWKTVDEIQDIKEYCAECLTVAIENWKKMASMLEEREFYAEMEAQKETDARKAAANRSWGEWTWSFVAGAAANVPQEEEGGSPPTPETAADAQPTYMQADPYRAADDAEGTLLERPKTQSQGPWAQEARQVEQRFLDVRKKIREERIARKEMAERGLWGFG